LDVFFFFFFFFEDAYACMVIVHQKRKIQLAHQCDSLTHVQKDTCARIDLYIAKIYSHLALHLTGNYERSDPISTVK
jgi:hypothetical protein